MVDNEYILDVPILNKKDLPTVSVITITKDRELFFKLAINNWKNFIYEHSKIEWIILFN